MGLVAWLKVHWGHGSVTVLSESLGLGILVEVRMVNSVGNSRDVDIKRFVK